MSEIEQFIEESNRIEGIVRPAKLAEIEEFKRFMALPYPGIDDLEQFVSIYEPGARLRDKPGMDVIVGNHRPTKGGPGVTGQLIALMAEITRMDAFNFHCHYERLHPFTDCNGRSGRMLWAWKIRDLSLGFLHRFYYQTLSHQ
jgi:Fic/DOC family